MRNNNKEIIALLAKREYKANKARSAILISAVAFAVVMLFGVFSLAVGRIDADCLFYMRNNGTAANTVLERATEKQYEQIKNLSYIKSVGKYIYFGSTSAFACAVLDTEAWEEMKKPAFSDIYGTYPKKKEEVMLPVRVLEEMGIVKPEIGMEIPLSIKLLDETEKENSFRLCGYYTEYVDPAEGAPDGYFSKEYLKSVPGYNDLDVTLLLKQNDQINAFEIEERLYTDVEMRDNSQQFFGGNTMTWEAVYGIIGGFDSAAVFGLVILLSAGLLIYNVLHISLSRDIRKYGLLKTLGTTRKQLKSIVFRQVGITVLWGCLAGAALGLVIVLTFLPRLLSNMYLQGFGTASQMIAFYPELLVLSVLFAGAVTFISSVLAINRAAGLTPIESMKYMESTDDKKAVNHKNCKKHTRRSELAQMAWRNILRSKKPFFITVLSLTLGIIVSLEAVTITTGTDTTNEINYELPDFKIMSQVSALNCEEFPENEEIFPAALLEKLRSLKGVRDSITVKGGFGKVSLQEEALKYRLEDFGTTEELCPFVVQEVSDDYLKELTALAEANNLSLDLDKVIDGEGMILLHWHTLSKIEKEESKDTVGLPINIYGLDGEKIQDMTFCGYLDFKEKDFPELQTTWNGPSILYFLTSEKGFQNMGLTEQTFSMHLTVDSETEPVTKENINQLINRHNKQYIPRNQHEEMSYQDRLGLDVTAKSDILASAKGYIDSMRLVMGAICAILLFMGLINYVNVIMTNLAIRKKEFVVMESIGATEKQLKKMLLLEGIFYSLFITIFTAVLGSGILYATGKIMKAKIRYFVFHYPAAEFILSVAALFAACILIPLIVYRQSGKESLSENLRAYME